MSSALHRPEATTTSGEVEALVEERFYFSPNRIRAAGWQAGAGVLGEYGKHISALSCVLAAMALRAAPAASEDVRIFQLGLPAETQTPNWCRALLMRSTSATSRPGQALGVVRRDLERGIFPAFSDESLDAARRALARLDARAEEDVDEWAQQLASDLSKHDD